MHWARYCRLYSRLDQGNSAPQLRTSMRNTQMHHRSPARNGQAARAELGVLVRQARAERGEAWRECFSWRCARSKAKARQHGRPAPIPWLVRAPPFNSSHSTGGIHVIRHNVHFTAIAWRCTRDGPRDRTLPPRPVACLLGTPGPASEHCPAQQPRRPHPCRHRLARSEIESVVRDKSRQRLRYYEPPSWE